jgi:hypothetical protein
MARGPALGNSPWNDSVSVATIEDRSQQLVLRETRRITAFLFLICQRDKWNDGDLEVAFFNQGNSTTRYCIFQ